MAYFTCLGIIQLIPYIFNMNLSFETLQIVAKVYNISLDDLKGGEQRKDIIEARQLAAYLLTELNYFYYPDVEKILGEDQTTIIDSYNKISRDMKIKKEFRTFVRKILDYLQKVCAPPKYEFITSEHILEAKNYVLEKNKKRSIEITKREAYILSKYRQGIILKKIGRAINVSVERVRQILLRAFEKELDRKLLNRFLIDSEEYVNYQIDVHNKLCHLLNGRRIKRPLQKQHKAVNSLKKTVLGGRDSNPDTGLQRPMSYH